MSVATVSVLRRVSRSSIRTASREHSECAHDVGYTYRVLTALRSSAVTEEFKCVSSLVVVVLVVCIVVSVLVFEDGACALVRRARGGFGGGAGFAVAGSACFLAGLGEYWCVCLRLRGPLIRAAVASKMVVDCDSVFYCSGRTTMLDNYTQTR